VAPSHDLGRKEEIVMDRKRLGFWAPIVVLAAALLMLAVSTDAVEAARGGGKGGGKPSRSSATLSVSPNPVPLLSTSVTISGSGFAANQPYSVQLVGICCFKGVITDANGAFSLVYDHEFYYPGTYTAEAWNSGGKVAATTFTVQ